MRRYGPQDLASKAAVLAGALALDACDASTATVALIGALLDVAAFYAVALARELHSRPEHSARACVCALALEYGPAELVDLAARPVSMGVVLGSGLGAVAALIAGSVAADVLFYACAAGARKVRTLRADPGECAKGSQA